MNEMKVFEYGLIKGLLYLMVFFVLIAIFEYFDSWGMSSFETIIFLLMVGIFWEIMDIAQNMKKEKS